MSGARAELGRCATGDGNAAIGCCAVCGNPICAACVGRRIGDQVLCHTCASRELAQSLGERIIVDEAATWTALQEVAAARHRRWRRRLMYIAGAILAIEILVLVGIHAITPRIEEPGVAVPSASERQEAMECLFRLGELAAGRLRPEQSHCPVTGQPYVVLRDETGEVIGFACPNPKDHGLEALEVDHEGRRR